MLSYNFKCMAVSTIHCYTVLAYIESGFLSYRLLVYGGRAQYTAHRVGTFGELGYIACSLTAFSVWR